MSEENCYEKDGKLWNLPRQIYEIFLICILFLVLSHLLI